MKFFNLMVSVLVAHSVVHPKNVSCPYISTFYECYGIGNYSDHYELCDLSKQVCMYVHVSSNNQKPYCESRPKHPLVCPGSKNTTCTCEYDKNTPRCQCSGYTNNFVTYVAILGCVLMIILFIVVCFGKRLKDVLPFCRSRDNRDNTSENSDNPPPPSFNEAMRMGYNIVSAFRDTHHQTMRIGG